MLIIALVKVGWEHVCVAGWYPAADCKIGVTEPPIVPKFDERPIYNWRQVTNLCSDGAIASVVAFQL